MMKCYVTKHLFNLTLSRGMEGHTVGQLVIEAQCQVSEAPIIIIQQQTRENMTFTQVVHVLKCLQQW